MHRGHVVASLTYKALAVSDGLVQPAHVVRIVDINILRAVHP